MLTNKTRVQFDTQNVQFDIGWKLIDPGRCYQVWYAGMFRTAEMVLVTDWCKLWHLLQDWSLSEGKEEKNDVGFYSGSQSQR